MFRKSYLKYVAMSLMLLAVLVLSGCAELPSSVSDAEAAPNLTVIGLGEAKGTPDTAWIQLGVNIVDSDVGSAVVEANSITEAVRAAVMSFGIEEKDVQTTTYNVWPEDRYDPQTGIPTGERVFRVDSTLQITAHDLSIMGDVIAAALDAGANSVYGISFGIEDTAVLSRQARELAIADANERAQQLSENLGVMLGEVVYASEGGGVSAFAYPAAYAEAAYGIGGGCGGAPVSSGQATVTVQVSVTFAIVP